MTSKEEDLLDQQTIDQQLQLEIDEALINDDCLFDVEPSDSPARKKAKTMPLEKDDR